MLPFIQVSAGGSLSNTLIGLSRLGQADNCLRGSGGFQVALAAAVGSDTLGSFFAAQADKAGVAILEESVADSCTGVHTPPHLRSPASLLSTSYHVKSKGEHSMHRGSMARSPKVAS